MMDLLRFFKIKIRRRGERCGCERLLDMGRDAYADLSSYGGIILPRCPLSQINSEPLAPWV